MTTKKIVKAITTALEAKGVVVTVQPAITTSSVYLSFDYGVLKRARVGDHKGKGYHYTYEIGSHVKPPYEIHRVYEGSEYTCYRYTEDQVDDLVMQVLILRTNLRVKYGEASYERFKQLALSKPRR